MDEGMQIDCIDEQLLNADPPKLETLQPGSNVKLASFQQSAKHDIEMR
jgi:hypothetical protein